MTAIAGHKDTDKRIGASGPLFALSLLFAAGAQAEETLEQLMARGEAVYGASCAACHQANGEGIAGAFPTLVGGSVTVGPIEEHMKIVLYGKPGTAMVGFGQQLSDADAAALVTYERNAWGNDALLAEGAVKVVQPADVAAYRNGGG